MLGESKCEQAPQMPGQEVLRRPTNTVCNRSLATDSLCHKGTEADLRGNIICTVCSFCGIHIQNLSIDPPFSSNLRVKRLSR